MTDMRELTIDEIETVSGGKLEIDFGWAKIWGDKALGCVVGGISFHDGSYEGGFNCPATR